MREEAVLAGLRGHIDKHERTLLAALPESRRSDLALQSYVADRAAVQATLERTEQIIDELEAQLRERCPRVSHITIEVQGIVEDKSLQPEIYPRELEEL
jgi:zinc transporter 9